MHVTKIYLWYDVYKYRKIQIFIYKALNDIHIICMYRSQRIVLPSFLEFDEENEEKKNVLAFKKKNVMTLMDMVK